jgi:superfamily II DNA helicase RecQ
MPFRLFQYTLPAPPELEDLNSFLASHRIAAVTQHLVTNGGSGMLVFIVETAGTTGSKPSLHGGPKIDYRDQLAPDDFARFNRLRDERKKWAETEGLPVYSVFTNAQLAEMVRIKVAKLSDLARIEGVGAARLEKYGARLLGLLAPPPPPPATEGTP